MCLLLVSILFIFVLSQFYFFFLICPVSPKFDQMKYSGEDFRLLLENSL
nr:ATP synthase F0 subunit 8 [Falcolipeurus marginalis]UTT72604.1 ATP synthase F0 subunit 8 [Falcolipeurus marginalis]